MGIKLLFNGLLASLLLAGSALAFDLERPAMPVTRVVSYTIPYTAVISAAVTHDVTITTLPARAVVKTAVARVTTPFVCAAVCTTATLSATFGKTAGGTELLASFDLDAAAAVFGDADGEVGSGLTAAGGTNGGYIPAWTTTQAVIVRMTSGTGNWGDGAVTNLNAGSVTVWVVYEAVP